MESVWYAGVTGVTGKKQESVNKDLPEGLLLHSPEPQSRFTDAHSGKTSFCHTHMHAPTTACTHAQTHTASKSVKEFLGIARLNYHHSFANLVQQ